MTTQKTPTETFAQAVAEALATARTTLEALHLEQRVEELSVGAERAAKRAVEQAGELAHARRDQVLALLDKGEAAIGARTEGRYAAQLGTVRAHLLTGLDKLATKRPHADADADAGVAAPPSPQDAPHTPRDETAA
jgi:hypothetical protein